MTQFWPKGFFPDGASKFWPAGYWPSVGDQVPDVPGFQEVVFDWAEIAFGSGNVLWADQDFPRLPFPYASLHWFSEIEVGLPEVVLESDPVAMTVNEQVQETRRAILQVETFTGPAGTLAAQEAMEFMESGLLTLQASPVTRIFREAGVSFLSHERPIRLDEFNGRKWERRAVCDVHFLITISSEQGDVGQIDTAVPTLNLLQ